MVKKTIIIMMLLLVVSTALTGCFGMGGDPYGAPQFSPPPQKEFKSVEELAKAVLVAKASASADETDLKSLEYCYGFKALPQGAAVSSIKVSGDVVRVSYSFGPSATDSYDNQMEIAWYRKANVETFLNDMAKVLVDYDTVSVGGMDYLHKVPDVSVIVTAAPGSTASAAPTPITVKYCQLVYWVQDSVAFMAAMPLGFTKEDIGKYCAAQKITIK